VRRRDFIATVGGAAAVWPIASRAQQPGKLPTIGFLGTNASVWRPWTAAFVERLRELGWIEGRSIAIEYRWLEGHLDRGAEIAAEFVRLKVDCIVTNGDAVPTIKEATSVIPIVFAIANDPVGGGLVASLARPGGNVTGLSGQATDLAGKRLELLREVVPRLRRLAIMFNVGYPSADGRGPGRGSRARHRSRTTRSPASGGYCSGVRHAQGASRRTLPRGRHLLAQNDPTGPPSVQPATSSLQD
jgi:putative ABC transport system substrate-binding protein